MRPCEVQPLSTQPYWCSPIGVSASRCQKLIGTHGSTPAFAANRFMEHMRAQARMWRALWYRSPDAIPSRPARARSERTVLLYHQSPADHPDPLSPPAGDNNLILCPELQRAPICPTPAVVARRFSRGRWRNTPPATRGGRCFWRLPLPDLCRKALPSRAAGAIAGRSDRAAFCAGRSLARRATVESLPKVQRPTRLAAKSWSSEGCKPAANLHYYSVY
jgi:hypothetical protein